MVLFHDLRLRKEVAGKRVVVTGATDGIGEELAKRLAEAGATVTIVGRNADKIELVKTAILQNPKVKANRGKVSGVLADCSKLEDVEKMIAEIQDHSNNQVDILVCNVGLSIRRSVKYEGPEAKTNRFHDFERLMKLNYFGSLKTILGFIPDMKKRGCGQIVHVSSFAVPMRQTRFAGYMASKSALDSAMQAIAGEHRSFGITTSSVYMPLVATKMIVSKGNDYSWMPIFSTVDAARMIERAIITKEQSVMDIKSKFVDFAYFFVPRIVILLMAFLYDLEKERNPDDPKSPTKDQSPNSRKSIRRITAGIPQRSSVRRITSGIDSCEARKAAVKVGNSFGFLQIVGVFLKFVNFCDPLLEFLFMGPLMPLFAAIFAFLALIRDVAIFIRPGTDFMLKYNLYWPTYIAYCALVAKVRPNGCLGWFAAVVFLAITLNAFYANPDVEFYASPDIKYDEDDADDADEDEEQDEKELPDVRTEDEADEPPSKSGRGNQVFLAS